MAYATTEGFGSSAPGGHAVTVLEYSAVLDPDQIGSLERREQIAFVLGGLQLLGDKYPQPVPGFGKEIDVAAQAADLIDPVSALIAQIHPEAYPDRFSLDTGVRETNVTLLETRIRSLPFKLRDLVETGLLDRDVVETTILDLGPQIEPEKHAA